MSDIIKEAERNVVRTCRVFDELNKILDAVSMFANEYLTEDERREFSDKFLEVRRIFDSAFRRNIFNLFCISTVGGEEAKEYAREKLEELFSEEPIKKSVAAFLSQHGYSTVLSVSKEKELREAVRMELGKEKQSGTT